ncbi:acyltransferase [uncultured Parabacteroides sp.]|uniref:acyltransferase family protein n=1 Tax=uncultured Parabacteroides sp. TaxID=512312 RepID=UPI00259B1269|nr:acyltransferase [uncultured Parabacteroides sp.]
MKTQNKDLSIETFRGIAILLVVMGHVIGSKSTGGMQVDDDSIYRYLYCLFDNIKMPLFIAIAGWVYSLHPVEKGKLSEFILKKAKRLILPMIFVGTTYFILQYLTPGTNNKGDITSIWKIYIYPYTLYWFLPALFLTFIVTSFLDLSNLMNTVKKWAIITFISWGLCFSQVSHIIPDSIPNLFAFKNALYLMPFFFVGVGLNRFKDNLATQSMKNIYLIGLIIGVILQQIDFFTPMEYYNKLHLNILIGMISSAYLISIKINIPFFTWLAQYAYSIYLFHGFGTSAGRIIFRKLHMSDLSVFIGATIMAVVLSIIIEKALIKWRPTKILFLGKK